MSYDPHHAKAKKGSQKPRRRGPKLWVKPDEDGNLPVVDEEGVAKLTGRGFTYCVWLLGRSELTEKQLTDKMKAKNAPETVIENVLAKLREYGYVDDERMAENTARRKSTTHGKRAISFDLSRKGVDKETVEAVLESYTEDDEREAALELARKKFRSLSRVDEDKQRSRLAGFLARRGFGANIVWSVVSEVVTSEDDDFDSA